jgi:hypothetical protein
LTAKYQNRYNDRVRTIIIVLLGGLYACGGDNVVKPKSVDMASTTAMPDMELLSKCGRPGDTGNSIGVGLFCHSFTDCAANSVAKLCTTIVNGITPSAADLYFCTMTCDPTVSDAQCGENAYCLCGSGACGCVPNRCFPRDM